MSEQQQPSPWDEVGRFHVRPHPDDPRLVRHHQPAEGEPAGFYMWAQQVDTARQQVEAQHAEEVKALTAQLERQKSGDTLLEAFDAGQEAAGRGEAKDANPYDPGDSWGVPLDYQYWNDGYDLMNVKSLRAQLASLQATVTAREQERCEWREDEARTASGCERGAYAPVGFVKSWKVCPYCGKPLEITRLKGERA